MEPKEGMEIIIERGIPVLYDYPKNRRKFLTKEGEVFKDLDELLDSMFDYYQYRPWLPIL